MVNPSINGENSIFVTGKSSTTGPFASIVQCFTGKGATSSTTQGGGGSFKNRKPTGEVGCCESRMVERIH